MREMSQGSLHMPSAGMSSVLEALTYFTMCACVCVFYIRCPVCAGTYVVLLQDERRVQMQKHVTKWYNYRAWNTRV